MGSISIPYTYSHVLFSPPLRYSHRLALLPRRTLPQPGHRSALSTTHQSSPIPGIDEEGDGDVTEKRLKDYFEQTAVLVNSTASDGAGPRWFTPVDCGAPRFNDVPLFLYLPGIDGVGLGLARHHGKLGKIFEVWCLHIPTTDRTPFAELVKLVDATVKSEHSRSPKRPIYLIGEDLGACLALAVASRNAKIDLLLILVNPATSFSNSPLQQLAFLLAPFQPLFSNDSLLNLERGHYVKLFVDAFENSLGQLQIAKDLFQVFLPSSDYSVIADIFPGDTFSWKIAMLEDGCAHANSRLHAIKAETLILSSGRDPLLPSQEEGERLRNVLQKCEIRKFNDNGHFLLLEDGIDLVFVIKGVYFYRRGRAHDYVVDFLQPTIYEVKRLQNQLWWIDQLSPVMLSTLEDGKIIKGLDGFPMEGPTLLVGNHMLMALESIPLLLEILVKKNIQVRALAHPLYFMRSKGKILRDISLLDSFKSLGIVPVSAKNLFRLLASNSHVLLYPGGVREALHRKGEEYKLFWPEEAEFVRMAARFGAKIVPFGVVGEDDIGQVALDYDDLVRIPYFKEKIEEISKEVRNVRAESSGQVSNQPIHLPIPLPKVPGRLYFLFGKPIDLAERRQEMKDTQKAQDVYIEVKVEVEKCLAYLKEKRETDSYRSIMSRLIYMSTHDTSSEIPTFDL